MRSKVATPRYERQFENLRHEFKEQVLFAYLSQRLFLEGLALAVPKPDTGDDLWVCDISDSQNPFFRCQIKSAYSSCMEGKCRKFTVNFTKTAKSRLSQRFYFFIGLYDPSARDDFHIGCLSSGFFQRLEQLGHLRFTGQQRNMLDFLVGGTRDNPTYSLRLKYPPTAGKKRGSGPPADLTKYFTHLSMRDALACDETK